MGVKLTNPDVFEYFIVILWTSGWQGVPFSAKGISQIPSYWQESFDFICLSQFTSLNCWHSDLLYVRDPVNTNSYSMARYAVSMIHFSGPLILLECYSDSFDFSLWPSLSQTLFVLTILVKVCITTTCAVTTWPNYNFTLSPSGLVTLIYLISIHLQT